MAPAQSKLKQTEKSGQRKRKVSSRIIDENFVGAESNAVTKRLKLSANAAPVASKKKQASVENIEDEDSTVNIPPKNPNAILEAADGSDDGPTPAPDSEELEPDKDGEVGGSEEEDEEPVENVVAQRGESNKIRRILWIT